MSKKIEWLGFKYSGDGVEPLVNKAGSIKNLPIPKNNSDLRQFLLRLNKPACKNFPKLIDAELSPLPPIKQEIGLQMG